jgi:hypothetical protein
MNRIHGLAPVMLGAGVVVALSLTVTTMSHETYRFAFAGNEEIPGCIECHGEFTDATSPGGQFFPSNNKHAMHRSSSNMNADCALCHTNTGDNPFTGSSAGTELNPGIGCTGCHEPVGLRAHHAINDETSCAGCHPNDPAPPPEGTVPVYYGTADSKVDDPCLASGIAPGEEGQEVWTLGDSQGLDNDGDNLYDGTDPDCMFCLADITGPDGLGVPDGNVDALDYLALIGQWGTPCVGSCEADITGAVPGVPDGNVDSLDFLSVIAQWGSPGNC